MVQIFNICSIKLFSGNLYSSHDILLALACILHQRTIQASHDLGLTLTLFET